MRNDDKAIGIVVPCFNEESRFDLAYWTEIISNLSHIDWLFVNDGSTDSTSYILSSLSSQTGVKVLENLKNVGKAETIRVGMLELTKSSKHYLLIGYIDSDRAFEIHDLSNITSQALSLNQENDPDEMFLGSRVKLAGSNITRTLSRHYIGRLVSTFVSYGWKNAPYDTQCGFKLIRVTNFLNEALEFEMKTRWFVDLELIIRMTNIKKSEIKLKEIPLHYWTEVSGSKINLKNISLLKEILYIRKLIKTYLVKE